MKNIFLDTNFLMDYFIRFDSFPESEQLLIMGKRQNYEFFVSYLSIANFAYIVRKMSPSLVYELIEKICRLFTVVENNKEQILNTISLRPKDFEDGLQYQSAIDCGCDCIITRNENDFKFSNIPVMTALEFTRKYL